MFDRSELDFGFRLVPIPDEDHFLILRFVVTNSVLHDRLFVQFSLDDFIVRG